MDHRVIAEFFNLFCAGILAGMEVAIHFGFTAPAETLDERAQLRLRQALVLRLRVLVPLFFVPTALSAIFVLASDGAAPGLWFRAVAAVALLVWIGIRIVGTVPINSATLEWQLDAPPKNWKALVNHAERFHTLGVAAAVMAFACFLAAVALRLGGR